MKRLLLLFPMLVLSWTTRAAIMMLDGNTAESPFPTGPAEGWQVGEGTEVSAGIPLFAGAEYSVSQQLYTADEIGDGEVDITSLSLYCDPGFGPRNIEIYLKNCTHDFNSMAQGFVSPGELVFCGDVYFSHEAWTTIPLVHAFHFGNYYSKEGEETLDRLLVTIIDNTGSVFRLSPGHGFASYPGFLVYSNEAEEPCTYYANGNSAFQQDKLSSIGNKIGYSANLKNQIRFNEESYTNKPTGLQATDVSFTTATVKWDAWHAAEDILGWYLEWRKVGEGWTALGGRLNPETTTWKLSYLSPRSNYEFRVCWVTGTEDDPVLSNWTEKRFSTDLHPTGITITNITPTSAQINWESPGSESVWDFQYKRADQTKWSGSNGIEVRTQTLRDLQPFTDYNVRIRTTDGDETYSSWEEATFCTEELYPRPTDLRVISESTDYAVLTWKERGEAKAWQLCVNGNVDNLIDINGPGTIYYLHGLEAGTSYFVKVRSVVEDGNNYSAWSEGAYFTTDYIDAPNIIDYAVTATTANIEWNGNNDSYTLNYRKLGQVIAEGITDWKSSEGVNIGVYADDGITFSKDWPDPQTAVSPELTGTENGAIIELEYKSESGLGGESFSVGYSTTTSNYLGTGVFSWEPGGALESGDAGTHTFKATLPAGVKYVALGFMTGYTDNLIISNIKIFSLPESEWQSVETDFTSYELTGLQKAQPYECKVVGHTHGEPDAESHVLEFTTAETNVAPYDIAVSTKPTSATITWKGESESYRVIYHTLPVGENIRFQEDFESSLEADGWLAVNKGDGPDEYNWNANTAYHKGGKQGASSYCVDGAGHRISVDHWLISPQTDLGGELRYWVRASGMYWEQYEVLLSLTGNDPDDFTTKLGSFQRRDNTWEVRFIDLSEYEGKQGYIAIRHHGEGGVLSIDDFAIYDPYKPAGTWQSVETDQTEVTLTGLEKETEYEYMIEGYDTEGTCECLTDYLTFRTANEPWELSLWNLDSSASSDIDAYNGVSVDATIQQFTLKKDGEWHTICLPFDVDVENSVMKGATIRTPETLIIRDKVLIVSCLNDVTKMQAGVPYLYKWPVNDTDEKNPTFYSVTINNRYPDVGFESGGFSFTCEYEYSEGIDYIPSYKLGEGGQLTPFNSGQYLGAFEAYFLVDEVYHHYFDYIVLNLGDNKDTITALTDVKQSDGSADTIYNLAGQRLQKMQKGINIVDGKKILVK